MNTSFIKVNILLNGVSRCLSASQGVSWCLLVSDVMGYFSWHLLVLGYFSWHLVVFMLPHSVSWRLIVSYGVS